MGRKCETDLPRRRCERCLLRKWRTLGCLLRKWSALIGLLAWDDDCWLNGRDGKERRSRCRDVMSVTSRECIGWGYENRMGRDSKESVLEMGGSRGIASVRAVDRGSLGYEMVGKG